jgi:hypothetical protein
VSGEGEALDELLDEPSDELLEEPSDELPGGSSDHPSDELLEDEVSGTVVCCCVVVVCFDTCAVVAPSAGSFPSIIWT